MAGFDGLLFVSGISIADKKTIKKKTTTIVIMQIIGPRILIFYSHFFTFLFLIFNFPL